MKIKYYLKYLGFMLPIYIICFFLGACSKLGDRYHAYDYEDVDIKYDEAYIIERNWNKILFGAIEKGDKDLVNTLLSKITDREFITQQL